MKEAEIVWISRPNTTLDAATGIPFAPWDKYAYDNPGTQLISSLAGFQCCCKHNTTTWTLTPVLTLALILILTHTQTHTDFDTHTHTQLPCTLTLSHYHPHSEPPPPPPPPRAILWHFRHLKATAGGRAESRGGFDTS